MNASCYVELLQLHAVPFVSLLGDNFVWQQDNAPPQTAAVVKQWLQESGWTVMAWPAQSPDLSPIENLWARIGRLVRETQPATLESLWRAMASAWQQVTPLQC